MNNVQNPGELSSRDQAKMTRLLQRTLTPREAREVLSRFSTDSRGRSIEWIVAAAEREAAPSKSLRLPDDSVYQLLIELAGPDLLADRELRRLIALHSHDRIREQLHDYPSATRGSGGDRSKATAVAQRKWHPGKSWAVHFVRTIKMPLVFAGSKGTESLPDTLEVEPCVKLPALADFQQ